MLRDDAQPLWDALFEHLVLLVTCKIMSPNEVAAVFVPCMVSDKSPYQDKVFDIFPVSDFWFEFLCLRFWLRIIYVRSINVTYM